VLFGVFELANKRAIEMDSDNVLALYRECAGVVQLGDKMSPIAGAFAIQAMERSD
jgi:hypothetical protein